MRAPGIHGARCIEVAIWFLRPGNNVEHAVDILYKTLVAEGLQRIARALYCLIHIGIIERIAADHIILAWPGCLLKVGVSARFLTLAEGERNGYLPTCLQTLPPKRVGHFHFGKLHRGDGIIVSVPFLCAGAGHHSGGHDK